MYRGKWGDWTVIEGRWQVDRKQVLDLDTSGYTLTVADLVRWALAHPEAAQEAFGEEQEEGEEDST